MASNWNTLMEGLQRTGLTQHEQRVLAAVVRRTLGFNTTEHKIAITYLAQATGLHRRDVYKALDRLEARHIVLRQGGGKGPGNAATLKLNLNVSDWRENAGEHPAIKTRANTQQSGPGKRGAATTQLADERPQKKERTRGTTPPPTPSRPLEELVIEAYVSTGGSLEQHAHREALTRNARLLHSRGTPTTTILAAAKALGREHTFPGYLIRKATELTQNGGTCEWEGLNHIALTLDQHRHCGCKSCQHWITAKQHEEATA